MFQEYNNEIKSKTLFSFNSHNNNNNSMKNIESNSIREYIYPICIYKNNDIESEEIRKIKTRMISMSKSQKYIECTKINNAKRYLSRMMLKVNKPNNKLNNNKNNLTIKKINRSKSNPSFPYSKQENEFKRRKYLSEIEKRGNFFNKQYIAALQRHTLNSLSLPVHLKKNYNEISKKNIIYNNINQQNLIEEVNNNDFNKVRIFLNNRIRPINMKNGEDLDDYFNLDKIKFLPKNEKKEFKFHVFHDINGLEKDISKPSKRELKMTKTRIRDLKVMNSINKIKDPEIIQKYRNLLYNN